MKYAAILFDMDGTLLETGPLWSKATRVALDTHNITLTEEEHFSLGGILLEHVLGAKGFNKETVDLVYRARDEALMPVMRAEAVWRDGAEEWIRSITIPKAIVTSAHKNILNQLDAKLGITDMFDAFIMADDVLPDYKPHPKGLLLACTRMGVDPTECIYIGDQSCDLEAAANAGMDSILIRGTHTPKELTHTTVAEDIAVLQKLLADRMA